MEQLGFFDLLDEKKPELRFEDLDPLAYLRAQINRQRESEDCGRK